MKISFLQILVVKAKQINKHWKKNFCSPIMEPIKRMQQEYMAPRPSSFGQEKEKKRTKEREKEKKVNLQSFSRRWWIEMLLALWWNSIGLSFTSQWQIHTHAFKIQKKIHSNCLPEKLNKKNEKNMEPKSIFISSPKEKDLMILKRAFCLALLFIFVHWSYGWMDEWMNAYGWVHLWSHIKKIRFNSNWIVQILCQYNKQ